MEESVRCDVDAALEVFRFCCTGNDAFSVFQLSALVKFKKTN